MNDEFPGAHSLGDTMTSSQSTTCRPDSAPGKELPSLKTVTAQSKRYAQACYTPLDWQSLVLSQLESVESS